MRMRQVIATRLEDGSILLKPLSPGQDARVADILGEETAGRISRQSGGPATRLNLPERQAVRQND